MPKRSRDNKEQNFEQSMRRLEEIVELIERGDIPLDDVMTLYEEGIVLSKQCLERLKQSEIKLRRLGKDLEGNIAITEGEESE